MVERAAVIDAFDEIKGLVRADGADMELVSVDAASGTVELRLLLEGVECHECVMPRPLLEDIACSMLQKKVPDVARVAIDDPREHPDYVPPEEG
jgi:Fe-S cluster biogenesis protein NfuA